MHTYCITEAVYIKMRDALASWETQNGGLDNQEASLSLLATKLDGDDLVLVMPVRLTLLL